MRVEELLVPGLILCRAKGPDKLDVQRELAEQVRRSGKSLDPGEIFDATSRRDRMTSQAIGQGIAICHLRTEKVQDLTIALATRPEGVQGFGAVDDAPVRVVAMFLIPKKHSDLYLRVMAALAEALSRPEVMDLVVAASNPEQVMAAFTPDEAHLDQGEVMALLSREGAVTGRVVRLLDGMVPGEVADLMEDLSPAHRAKCLGAVKAPRAAEVIRHMALIPLAATLRRMSPELSAQILSYTPSSRCADILQRLQPDEHAEILKHLVNRGRKEVQNLLKYPPHTAGGIMTPEALSVREDATVGDARRTIFEFKDRRQTDVYVCGADGRLLGRCEIHDLLTAEPDRRISELMKENPIHVRPEKDQEELRRLAANNTPRSIPVVGSDGALLGVVVQDDLLDVVEQEANEDLYRMMGTSIVDPLHTPLWVRIRLRTPWVLLTLGGELFIALVIARVFRPTLEKTAILAAFIPAIMATGGNVGLQSTSMIIRGLGMGTLKRRHTARIIFREVRMGATLGLLCGVLAGGTAYLINWHYGEAFKVSAAVCLAMMSATLATSFVGTIEPLILHRLKFDPATACGPFVTMFNDMFGSIVYFLIAMAMNFSKP